MIVRLSGIVPHAPVRFLRSEDRLVVAESHAHLIADYVRVFTREGENVGQEGLDALVHRVSPAVPPVSLADSPSPPKAPRRAREGRW
jgi:hypothetical protein